MISEPGCTGSVELTVTESDTAIALRSGDVPVLATPRLLALAEEASCAAVADHLDARQTTVGFRVQLDHVAAVGVGSSVKAEATLEKIEGRRLTFTVSVSDDAGLVAAGRITRVVVDRAQFLDKLR